MTKSSIDTDWMVTWRHTPQWVDNPVHIRNWDRILVAVGRGSESKTVTASTTPMTVQEARERARWGWDHYDRVVEVLLALRDERSRSGRVQKVGRRSREDISQELAVMTVDEARALVKASDGRTGDPRLVSGAFDILATDGARRVQSWHNEHRGTLPYERLCKVYSWVEEQGRYSLERIRQFGLGHEECDMLQGLLSSVTPRVEVPVPQFTVHGFRYWDGRLVLLLLPEEPTNLTHGADWVHPKTGETWPGASPHPRVDGKILDLLSAEELGYEHSGGLFSDLQPVIGGNRYQYDAYQNLEVQVDSGDGWADHPMHAQGGDSSHPLNCVPVYVSFRSCRVRCRIVGFHRSVSDQLPESGRWSEPQSVGGAFQMEDIARVFQTVTPDGSYYNNYSAPLGLKTQLQPSIQLA